MMDYEFYKDVIDQASENGTKAITLASRGVVVDDTRRNFLLGEILSHQLERPIDNLIRNQELDEQSAMEEELIL